MTGQQNDQEPDDGDGQAKKTTLNGQGWWEKKK